MQREGKGRERKEGDDELRGRTAGLALGGRGGAQCLGPGERERGREKRTREGDGIEGERVHLHWSRDIGLLTHINRHGLFNSSQQAFWLRLSGLQCSSMHLILMNRICTRGRVSPLCGLFISYPILY